MAPRSTPYIPSALCAALSLAALVGAGCSTPPEPAPTITGGLAAAPTPRKEFPQVLSEANEALAAYTEAVHGPNTQRSENSANQVARYLRQLERDYRGQFFSAARDTSAPAKQGIAAAMLGFSAAPEAMGTLLTCLSSDDEVVITNAALGLAILQDPKTPPAPLAAIVENRELPVETRACASWALFEIYEGSFHQQELGAIWEGMLQQPISHFDPIVLLSIVRGIGATRDPDRATLVEPFTEHPTPKIREAACIALGRMQHQPSWKTLVVRLEPGETNPNVRLAARKALQALAGDVDVEYDPSAWRRVFERGRKD